MNTGANIVFDHIHLQINLKLNNFYSFVLLVRIDVTNRRKLLQKVKKNRLDRRSSVVNNVSARSPRRSLVHFFRSNILQCIVVIRWQHIRNFKLRFLLFTILFHSFQSLVHNPHSAVVPINEYSARLVVHGKMNSCIYALPLSLFFFTITPAVASLCLFFTIICVLLFLLPFPV